VKIAPLSHLKSWESDLSIHTKGASGMSRIPQTIRGEARENFLSIEERHDARISELLPQSSLTIASTARGPYKVLLVTAKTPANTRR